MKIASLTIREDALGERISPRAGQRPDAAMLTDIPRLMTAYFVNKPDPSVAGQRVSFGTSGHRGSSFAGSFTEDQILATTQAICAYRAQQGITGPLFIGADTHALSAAALATAVEVLAANGVTVMLDHDDGYTPTPVISHAILCHNKGRAGALADGIVITPSHNPPPDGGFKYNPPHGGPADTDVTGQIERIANRLLEERLTGIRRMPYARARASGLVRRHDYVTSYVADLANVVDVEAIRASSVRIGIDPLGGSSVRYWQEVIERHRLNASVVNDAVDPTFRFMTADWDGKIRMDCSSRYAMASLIALRDRFDIAFANDPDADRHGIVTRSAGLMNPNHYLAVAIDYLFRNRPRWPGHAGVGKTIVSSSLIDRVAARLGRTLVEVPVGFKWFVPGLGDGSLAFGGEESAGASFVRRDGTTWTTDKDGLILGLLAAEITARMLRDPGEVYAGLTAELGTPYYERVDAAASAAQRAALKRLTPAQLRLDTLAGEPVSAILSAAPGGNQPIGGLKVIAAGGWFAVRPSGTEDVYKLYAESFRSADHLKAIQAQAQEAIARATADAAAAPA